MAKQTGVDMVKKTGVDITPDKSLIKKLGLTGYKTEEAIAELIDNSIDARIEGKVERIDVRLDFEKNQIIVSDNGMGMGIDELKDALTIAKETKKNGTKLGHFGLGMKSACSSLGKSFTLTTTKPHSPLKFIAKYDEDKWLSDTSKTWTNFEIEEIKKEGNLHGTTIIIRNLNIPMYPNQISNFKKRFGIRYGPYLENKQIIIRINSKNCEFTKPELMEGTNKQINIKLSHGNKITGWIGLLKKRSIKGDYGIHLYRNNRLIKAFDKFGIRNHPEVAKIIGKISLDHVPVNFHKTGFLEDSTEYKEAVINFKNDPTVTKVFRESSSQKLNNFDIKSIFEYDLNTTPEKLLDTRISSANAKSLLRKARAFTIQKDPLEINVDFTNMNKGVYQMSRTNDNIKININPSSDAFKAFKNPLLLLGLIRIEAEMMASNPSQYSDFIYERNEKWSKFIDKFLPKREIKKIRSDKTILLPNYSIANELMPLYNYLFENFEHDFQFTGLCTLTPFLHNAYKKIIYNIQTVTGAGQELLELISNPTKFIVMLEPKPLEVETILKTSKHQTLFIIREYAERLSTTWADPEKAWLDLYIEVNKNKITLYSDELIMIITELLDSGLVSATKLRSLARRRKILNEINKYIGDE